MFSSFSYTLILGAGIMSFLTLFFFPELGVFGINTFFYREGLYHLWIVQFFSSQLLHGSMFHFLFNALFVGYFGTLIENLLGYKKMFLFFILNSIFLGILITFLGSGNTIGMSGFAMAVLSYYTLELYRIKDLEYKGGITAILINIFIGFMPGISLLGHLGGVIFGAVFWYGNHYTKKYS